MSPAPHELAPGSVVFLLMVGACAVGLVLAAADRWQGGVLCIGGALAVGALVRLLLPNRAAGLLRVRRRLVDAATLGAMAFVIVFVALTIAARR